MAAGRDGEHTRRFQFLATVRTLVATVVTVLCVAVVVMVIVVVDRPVEMGFRSYGYVQAQDQWWRIVANTTPAHAVAPSYSYGPALAVDILLVLAADNHSGRGGIKGSINIIRVVDIRSLVQFCFFEPKKFDVNSTVNFDMPPHSSHRYRRWVRINTKSELQYLYDNRRQDGSGFGVLLVVETTYGQRRHSEKSVVYYCSPVTFLLVGDTRAQNGDDVVCKTAQEMGYTPNFTPS